MDVVNEITNEKFDVTIAAVIHRELDKLDIISVLKFRHVIFDVKVTRERAEIDVRL